MEQYVVTGIGIFNSLGKSSQESWSNLIAGKSAVKQIIWPTDDSSKFPATHNSVNKTKIAAPCVKLTAEDLHPTKFDYGWAHWDPNTRACLMSVNEAINDSGLTSKNTGVIITTFSSGTTTRLEVFHALNIGKTKFSPRKVLNIGLEYPASQVSAIYGFTGTNTAMDSACTTGITIIDAAITSMKADSELDAVVVGASDYLADALNIFWFQSLGALCPSEDPTANCPFDSNRSGFVMGEGAATIIIEPLSKAQARGAKIYGKILSTNLYTLFDSDTSPDPAGIGARTCVQKAIDKAGITANNIDFINAHATSTPVGDEIEYNAMLSLTPGRTMVSNKGQIGHTMSQAGIVETIYTLIGMQEGRQPGNANLVNSIGSDMILPTEAIELDVKYAIKNSFGFGGRNASMVLERFDS
jgi:3-oxoacyl-[acyl-carrier-protein] synthase II